MARSVITVTTVTRTITKASIKGTFRMILRLFQANVPITTMNITPTRAANGICSIQDDATTINKSRNKAAAIPASRVRPPDFTLIMDCPIMAHPPMPPKKPVMVFAIPWAILSWLAPPRLLVMSPTRLSVSRLSIKPIAARMPA